MLRAVSPPLAGPRDWATPYETEMENRAATAGLMKPGRLLQR